MNWEKLIRDNKKEICENIIHNAVKIELGLEVVIYDNKSVNHDCRIIISDKIYCESDYFLGVKIEKDRFHYLIFEADQEES